MYGKKDEMMASLLGGGVCKKMVSGYEINNGVFHAVSIAEGFREWVLPKEDKLWILSG